MYRSLYNKKGSLSLSINAIVVVVLAFVMLGLGITLTRNVLNQALDTSITIGDQTRDSILDVLRESGKKIAFPSKEVTIESGKKEIIAFGVSNVEDSELKYKIEVYKISGVDDTEVQDDGIMTPGQANGQFFWADTVVNQLDAGEAAVIALQYRAESKKGSYIYNVKLVRAASEDADADNSRAEETYAQEQFFVTVV